MGTRADFYVGRGSSAEWLGSIAFDGYPDGEAEDTFAAKTADEFRAAVSKLFAGRSDATLPEQGWPWPWDDSRTTDYAYAFDGDRVWISGFGTTWFDATAGKPTEEQIESADVLGKVAVFPNMKDRKNVTLGERSGLIVGVMR